MQEVADHIVSMRQRVCPRTSYVTSGAASTAYVLVANPAQSSSFSACAAQMKASSEFDKVQYVATVAELERLVDGNVVVTYGCSMELCTAVVEALLARRKTKLVVHVHATRDLAAIQPPSRGLPHSTSHHVFGGAFEVVSCFNYHRGIAGMETAVNTSKGFNGQPSVQSGGQFRYLWSPSTPQIEAGKDRVLQRLADRALHGGAGKWTTVQWDEAITGALRCGMDDYGVYNLVRQKTLGSSLAKDLEDQIMRGTATSSSAGAGKDTTEAGEDGDGRANHMVSRTLESIPPRLRLQPGAIRRMLDYGCAEGAITAALGKQLGLTPDRILGADVRAIPSVGFSFLQLPPETASPPELGAILPGIRDQSVDLITAAMVFHHVTHVKAALLELRRIVSHNGALVIREHHCVSADMGAFLDITHGLYSLSWSSPVEWPDFIEEYKAFYRSREEWDALIRETGFVLAVKDDPQALRAYNAAEFVTRKANGFFPNVIKAYYAVYLPDPAFKLPAVPPRKEAAKTPVTSDASRKRAAESGSGAAGDVEGSKRPREESIVLASPQSQASAQPSGDGVFESKKYPGRFYRLNPTTGATEWL